VFPAIETYSHACTDVLRNSSHEPKTRSLRPNLLGLWVILVNAHIAVLSGELHIM